MSTDADRPEPDSGAPTPSSPTTTALAIRRDCAHRWDLSRRTCLLCGQRVYVEVVIS